MDLSALKDKIPQKVFNELPFVVEKFGIKSPLRLAHFLAQCHHESASFSATVENLNYSAASLLRVFSGYFGQSECNGFAYRPEKIANRVYCNRNGNGNQASGDGYKYRGRGYIQLTGKRNYIDFGGFIGENLVLNPELVATKYPLMSAGYYFTKNNLWQLCDKGDDVDDVKAVTKAVNGGYNGLDERTRLFCQYMKILKEGA